MKHGNEKTNVFDMTVETATRTLAAGQAAIAEAARCLAGGGLVAFPTETVYGLGADATDGEAVARLYQAKGRPSFNPLIAHVPNLDAARAIARFNPAAERLAALWPGPLTLVLPRAPGCSICDLATAGLDTIAVRIPAHPVALDILRALGRPVVAPSANVSGHVSPTTAGHVLNDLGGRIDLIVDGGATTVGVESAIVSCLGEPVLLRAGGITRAGIEAVLGARLARPAAENDDEHPIAPGMLTSHYAPGTQVRLNARAIGPGEALLAFGPVAIADVDKAAAMMNLSERGDLVEAAGNLFRCLRELDAAGATKIAVMPVPDDGLGEAINDRLRRAAA